MVPGLSPFRRKAPFRGNLSVLDRSGHRERRLRLAAQAPKGAVCVVVGEVHRHAVTQRRPAKVMHLHLGLSNVQVEAVVIRDDLDAGVGDDLDCLVAVEQLQPSFIVARSDFRDNSSHIVTSLYWSSHATPARDRTLCVSALPSESMGYSKTAFSPLRESCLRAIDHKEITSELPID